MNATERNAAYYAAHRGAAVAPVKSVCRGCGGGFARVRRGHPPAYCSEACRPARLTAASRPCDFCSTPFTPTRGHWKSGRFCSQPCAKASWRDEAARRYWADAPTLDLLCPGCGVTFTVTTHRRTGPGTGARRFCSRGCGRRYAFRQRYGSGNYLQRPATTRKQRLVVFERDGWRCGICHAVIDQALRWPHPGSATLDHIVPLADGGDHMPSNWQAAHAACNIEKGNLRRRRAA